MVCSFPPTLSCLLSSLFIDFFKGILKTHLKNLIFYCLHVSLLHPLTSLWWFTFSCDLYFLHWASLHWLPRVGCLKTRCLAGHRWFMPVILATQETEIRRIMVQGQPGQNSSWDPYLDKTHHKKGLVEWHKQ
jgi:hypothetical protein